MANIEKRKSGNGKIRYRAKVRLKDHNVSATFDLLSQAKDWARKTEAEVMENKYFVQAKKHTLEVAINRYVKDVMPSKPKSAKDQVRYLEYWKSKLGDCCLSKLTPALIAQERDLLIKGGDGKPRSAATVNAYIAPLSHLLTIATREWGWLDESPIKRVTRPKLPKGRVRFLSDTERKSLLAECKASRNPSLYLIIVLALSTAARYSEILKLRWSDVDLDRGIITLHETKNGETRVLTLSGHALELMHARANMSHTGSELVFGKQGKTLDIRPAFNHALKRANITNFRFHDLRHSAASYLAMNGASLLEIAKILGHKTLAMAQRYAHLTNDHTSKIVAQMNSKIFGTE